MLPAKKTHATFLAEGFNRTDAKSDFRNENNFGEDLCRWLIQQFQRFPDLSVAASPEPEDWGWRMDVALALDHGSIGIGAHAVMAGHGEIDGRLCFWDPPKPKRALLPFRRQRFADFNHGIENCTRAVLSKLQQILSKAPAVSRVHWHDEDNFMAGNQEDWSPEPL